MICMSLYDLSENEAVFTKSVNNSEKTTFKEQVSVFDKSAIYIRCGKGLNVSEHRFGTLITTRRCRQAGDDDLIRFRIGHRELFGSGNILVRIVPGGAYKSEIVLPPQGKRHMFRSKIGRIVELSCTDNDQRINGKDLLPDRKFKVQRCYLRILFRHMFSGFKAQRSIRSEEHTSELQSRGHLVCRLLLEQKYFYVVMYFLAYFM